MTVPVEAMSLLPSGPADAPSNPTLKLSSRVSRLRGRTREGSLDRALLVIGGVLLPLGVLLVILGWLGASHTVLLFEQIPYVVSGGLLGLALVIVGGFVYFTYWQTLLVRESRTANRDLVAGLARIEAVLSRVAAPDLQQRPAEAAPVLVATAKGTMAHLPGCQVVAGRRGLRSVPADSPLLRPCRICQPIGLVMSQSLNG
jgi:hypothetical protein